MLPFKGPLNSDNPVSDDISESLQTWYYALALISSNFFAIPLFIYCHKHAIFLLAVATFVAMILSLLYHTCQTLDICFGMHLSTLTLCDHKCQFWRFIMHVIHLLDLIRFPRYLLIYT